MGAPASLFIGLMSGTSLDGVDAALVDFTASQPQLIATHFVPYPDDIRLRCLALHAPTPNELHLTQQLAQDLARLYAEAVRGLTNRLGEHARSITAIGCHGQTIRHQPSHGYSLQINAPALLAELTGLPVIADFRSRDIAAGGQGAPLVPAFHEAVFRDAHQRRVVVNIGGIANLTDMPPGLPTRGYDCGPGNMLMDAWIQKHQGVLFDADGKWSASGQVIPKLLTTLQAHPFFHQSPPKSCGREEFNLENLEGLLSGTEQPEDVQRTLLELSAQAIANAIHDGQPSQSDILLCGGGAHNTALRQRLAALMPHARIGLTDEAGVPADWVEAIAFAWLARQTWLGKPGNLPHVTGAKGPRVLGAIYPA